MAGHTLLGSLVVVAGLDGWVEVGVSIVFGTALSAIVAVLLGVFGVIEHQRERREERKRRKLRQRQEKEALESGGPLIEDPARSASDRHPRATKVPPRWTPGKEDRPPEGSPLLDALRRLWEDFRDLVDLGLSWVGLFCLFLLSAVFWLEPLVLKLGHSEDAATNARIVDLVLLVLTSAWLLTGIRTEKRSLRMRLLETTVLAVACLGALALFVSGFVGLGVVVVVLGGAAFVKAFL